MTILGKESNFDKYSAFVIDPFGESYDYGSVMHYSRTAFSVNGEETITPNVSMDYFGFWISMWLFCSIQDPDAEIGQRIYLSQSDINKLNNMYEGIC